MRGIKEHAVMTSRHARGQAQKVRFTSSSSSSMCADPAITGLDLTLQLPQSLLQPLPYFLFSSLPFLLFFCVRLSFPFFKLCAKLDWDSASVHYRTFPSPLPQVGQHLSGLCAPLSPPVQAPWLGLERNTVPPGSALMEQTSSGGASMISAPFLHLCTNAVHAHTHLHGRSLSLFTKCQTAIGVSYFCTVTEDM